MGSCPFSHDDLINKKPEILIKYCHKRLKYESFRIIDCMDLPLTEYLYKDCLDESFIKRILKIIDFNSCLAESHDLGELTRETVSGTVAIASIELFDMPNDDKIKELCKEYIDANWRDIVQNDRTIIQMLAYYGVDHEDLVDELISLYGDDGVETALSADVFPWMAI